MLPRSSEQKELILDYINKYRMTNGGSPSFSQIGAQFGVNRSTAYRYVMSMQEDGMLSYDGKCINTPQMNSNTVRVSKAAIVGSIPCGEADMKEEYIEDYVNLPENLFGKGEFYILRATGDSMEDAGIFQGDLVVIRKQSVADIGQIVVALDDEGQNTLKQFGGLNEKNYAVLNYCNESVYPGKTIEVKNLVVQGVAKHVIKALP